MKRLDDYSQHFLKSPRLVQELVGHSNLKKTDLVYDIGAGSGVISSVLSRRVARVVAVEIEPEAIKKLRTNMQGLANVEIIDADFLAMELPEEPYKVFANIPFHLSSKIIRKLTESPNLPQSIYLIVQRQFARKIVFSDNHFTGQIGALIGPQFTAKIRRPLRRTDFTPQPNVDTVLLELKKRDVPLVLHQHMPKYRKFVSNCFSTPKIFLPAVAKSQTTPKDKKPSELTLDQWVNLFNDNQKPEPTRRA